MKTDKGTPGCSKPLSTFKTGTDVNEKIEKTNNKTLSSSKPRSTIKSGTETKGKPNETTKTTLGCYKPMYPDKTYAKTHVKREETKKMGDSKPLPAAKTDTENKEKAAGESPSLQVKSLDFTSKS